MDNLEMYEVFKSWKDEYGEVRFIIIEDIEFYFRLITRPEYETLKKIEGNEFVVDEMIAELCVLDPRVDNWSEDIYAGFTGTIARVILEESLIIPKPNSSDDYIENIVTHEYNKVASSFEKQMPGIICKAFPAYKPTEVQAWPLTRQIETYGLALYILNDIDSYGIEFAEDD